MTFPDFLTDALVLDSDLWPLQFDALDALGQVMNLFRQAALKSEYTSYHLAIVSLSGAAWSESSSCRRTAHQCSLGNKRQAEHGPTGVVPLRLELSLNG